MSNSSGGGFNDMRRTVPFADQLNCGATNEPDEPAPAGPDTEQPPDPGPAST